uniref:Uncharacterized protein n=1 Tax=Anopheles dirus TaxID=7168 RepID=A0A182NWQ4_9DIPT
MDGESQPLPLHLMPIKVEIMDGKCSYTTHDTPAVNVCIPRRQTPKTKTSNKKRSIPDEIDLEIVDVLKMLRQDYQAQEQGINHGRYLNDTLKECDPDVRDTLIVKVQEAILEAQKEMARRRLKTTKDTGTDP